MSNFSKNPRNDEIAAQFVLSSALITQQYSIDRKQTCFKGTSGTHAADSVPHGNLAKKKMIRET